MFLIVLTTVKNRAEAKKISALVSEKRAACVNMLPSVSSVYRWRGKVERSSEVMLIIKTSSKNLDKLMARIKELHSYEVPEILALKVDRSLPQYLR